MATIGIIGAGQIGTAIATALARHGIPATLANSRGPESLADTVAALGPSITAGSHEEAASKDIVSAAVNWSKLPAALAGLPDFGRRIVVDDDGNEHGAARCQYTGGHLVRLRPCIPLVRERCAECSSTAHSCCSFYLCAGSSGI